MKPDTALLSYQNPPSINKDDDTDVPVVVTTNTPPTMTTSTHRSKWMGMVVVAVVASMMMLVLAGGVAVWMQQDAGSSYYTADVARQECAPCLPATTTFKGISTTTRRGRRNPLETRYQLREESTYCWAKSYNCGWRSLGYFSQCIPNGDAWNSIEAYYVNPVTTPNSSGTPCQHMHQNREHNPY